MLKTNKKHEKFLVAGGFVQGTRELPGAGAETFAQPEEEGSTRLHLAGLGRPTSTPKPVNPRTQE